MTGHTIILNGPVAVLRAQQLLARAPVNAVVNIKPPSRTNDQNAKFHAMISDIARAKPEGRVHSPVIWKSLLMAEAGFKPLFERSLDGQSIIPIGYKSSRLTKAEFSDLIEAAYAYGAEHGVVWSVEGADG